MVSRLAQKLNKAAEAVGALHHRIELVRRGPRTYFVTCARSPRFNWRVSLSHYDVGRNLDYFAPGHIPTDTPSPKCAVRFVEKKCFMRISSEFVFTDYLHEGDGKGDFLRYNTLRETLVNSTMDKLSLPYRFKCCVEWPDTIVSVQSVMAKSDPPSSEWWQDHCYIINCEMPGVMKSPKLAFCGYETRYSSYWPFLQETFEFTMHYKRGEFWETNGPTSTIFKSSLRSTLEEIKLITEGDLYTNFSEYEQFLAKIREKFVTLAALADILSNQRSAPEEFKPRLPESVFAYKMLLLKETVSLNVFHRNRIALKNRRREIGHPASGDQDAFQWFFT